MVDCGGLEGDDEDCTETVDNAALVLEADLERTRMTTASCDLLTVKRSKARVSEAAPHKNSHLLDHTFDHEVKRRQKISVSASLIKGRN